MQDLEALAIDPNLLLVLDALLQEQNVSRAAERLARTQPAVSHALARLREQLGDPLLVRVGQRLVLTPRAEALRRPLHDLLLQLAELTAPRGPFDAKTSTRTFSIVSSDYIVAVLVPQFFADLRAGAPGVDLMFRAVSGKLYHDLTDGGCDAAFVVRVDEQPGLKIRKLFSDRYVCLVAEDHPDVGRTLTLDLFLRLPHAFVAPGGTPGGAVDRALTELGHTRRVAVTVPHFFVAPALVEHTDLVITMPERIADMVAARHRLRKLPHPLKLPPFDVLLAWHERVQHDPGNIWLREQVVKAIRKT
jgi:DNA-binding transcriptional LysR family regulator